MFGMGIFFVQKFELNLHVFTIIIYSLHLILESRVFIENSLQTIDII